MLAGGAPLRENHRPYTFVQEDYIKGLEKSDNTATAVYAVLLRQVSTPAGVVLSIADENGKQISRQVVGVGVLQPEEMRRFSVSVTGSTGMAAPWMAVATATLPPPASATRRTGIRRRRSV